MGYNKTVPIEDRYAKIMAVLKESDEALTSSQICRIYAGQYTSSDVNSTGQILKVLSLAGVVRKIVTGVPGRRKTIFSYKLES